MDPIMTLYKCRLIGTGYHPVCVSGERLADGRVQIDNNASADGDGWHETRWHAMREAADELEDIADSLREQAKRMREAT